MGLVTTVLVCGAVSPASAQTNRPGFGRGGSLANRRLPLRNFNRDLKDMVELLSKRFEARIVVDPAILATSRPTPPLPIASGFAGTPSDRDCVGDVTALARNGAWCAASDRPDSEFTLNLAWT